MVGLLGRVLARPAALQAMFFQTVFMREPPKKLRATKDGNAPFPPRFAATELGIDLNVFAADNGTVRWASA
jgi:hypothetical protein